MPFDQSEAATVRSASKPERLNNDESLKPSKTSFCCCCRSQSVSKHQENQMIPAPDEDFHANCKIMLSHGTTAYRLLSPNKGRFNSNKNAALPPDPLIVCLHGFSSSSYIWENIGNLLSQNDQGPCAQVLVFDFYGHGRSEWTGNDLTLDVLVTQTKELLNALGFEEAAVSLVGFDLGGAVAAGFAAKHPAQCLSLSLLGPVGVSHSTALPEGLLRSAPLPLARLAMTRWGPQGLLRQVQRDFFDLEQATTHRHLVDKQEAMLRWQLSSSPGLQGFLGAQLSVVRHFPREGLQELFVAVGRHPRKALVLWGEQDEVCSGRQGMKLMERAFPRGFVVDVLDCGHNLVFEKFEDVVRELTSFHKLVFSHEPAL